MKKKVVGKSVAFILAIIMIVTLLPGVAMAEIPDHPETIAVDDEKAVSLNADEGEVVTFAFAPKKDGVYRFYSKGSYDAQGWVRSDNDEILKSDRDSGIGSNFLIEFSADEGETYYLQAGLESGYSGICDFTVVLEEKPVGLAKVPANPETITIGEEKSLTLDRGQVATFQFTPEEDSDYYFISKGDYRTKGCVLYSTDGEEELLEESSWGGPKDNFYLNFEAEEGETYYLQTMLSDTYLSSDYDGSSYKIKLGEGEITGFSETPENPQSIAVNEEKTVSVSEEAATFVFTPEEDGVYYFKSMGDFYFTKGTVWKEDKRSDGNVECEDIDAYNFRVVFDGKAGKKYYLQTCLARPANPNDPGYTGEYKVLLGTGVDTFAWADIPDDPQTLKDGNSITANFTQTDEVLTYVFTPEKNGTYYFGTEEDTDLDFNVFNGEKRVEKGIRQPNISMKLMAGTKYYIQLKAHQSSVQVPLKLYRTADEFGKEHSVKIGNTDVLLGDPDSGYTLNPDLPKGVEYDVESRTLTLTDCTIDLGGETGIINYLQSTYGLNIVLKGSNVFKGIKGKESELQEGGWYIGYDTTGIEGGDILTITGDGTLTIDLSESTARTFGIAAGDVIDIDGPTINIVGSKTGSSEYAFYGLNIRNILHHENEFVDENHVKINHSTINISNTVSGKTFHDDYNNEDYTIANIGIDSQDTDLIIQDSNVNIQMTGGQTWGICTGFYYDRSISGGKLSIDDKSTVRIKLLDTHELTRKGDYVYAIYFWKNDVNSNYIYVANPGEAARLVDKESFWRYYIDRLESHYSFVEFSPVAVQHDDPVIPGDTTTHTHVLTKHTAKAATCTSDGNTEYWSCSGCGNYFSDAEGEHEITEDSWVIPATGHREVVDQAVAATCTEEGKTEGKHCSVCGEVTVKQETVPVASHNWGSNYIVDKAATCKEEGSESIHCSVCGAVKEDSVRSIEKADHTYGEWKITTAATCTEAGSKEKSCSVCGDKVTEEIPATGHTPTVIPAVPATCTTSGLTEGSKCSTCGIVLQAPEIVESSGHSYGEWTTTREATCTEAGEKVRICRNDADHKETEEIPAIGHKWDEGVVTKPATESEEGVRIFTCQNNPSHTITEPIPKLGHTHHAVKVEAKKATCTSDGNIEYYSCTDCGLLFSDEACTKQILPDAVVEKATGHAYGTPTYDWSDDYSQVTARVVCENDASHILTETVDTTKETMVEATKYLIGLEQYIAVFKDDHFEQQEKRVTIPKLPVPENPDPVNPDPVDPWDEEDYDDEDDLWEELERNLEAWNELDAQITAARKINNKKNTYTAASFKAFTKALNEAQDVLDNMDATTQEYQAATKKVKAARQGLVKTISISGAAVTLNKTTMTYTGKVLKCGIKSVKLKGKALAATNYNISYKSNKAVGTATVTITGKGRYIGSVKKTFKINPKGTALSGLTSGKTTITVKWKKQATQTTGYQIQYSTNSKFTKPSSVKVKGHKKLSYTVQKLKANKKYYVRIRTYKTIGKTTYSSGWSAVKNIKTARR